MAAYLGDRLGRERLCLSAPYLRLFDEGDVDVGLIALVYTGVLQGIVGFLLTPVSALAFWTLPQKYRTEGSGMFELSRTLGSSIGVSIRTGTPARYVQMNRCRTHHTVQRCDAESVDLELPESAYAPWVIDALDATLMRMREALMHA